MERDPALAGRLPEELTLRRATGEDRAFLCDVYASTREEELARTDWSPEMKRSFVLQQFEAQDRWYRENVWPDAEYLVVAHRGRPAGRLYLNRSERETRIIDVALLPAYRGNGLGTSILRALQAECAEAGRELTIHVERFNPALGLYERLGFALAEDKGVYLFMRWTPGGQLNTAS
jgi:ribosomal protein S18 acetylase RimI-like enzyme